MADAYTIINLVNDKSNVRRPGPVLKFSDLEVVALTLAAETESFDSENWLFEDTESRLAILLIPLFA